MDVRTDGQTDGRKKEEGKEIIETNPTFCNERFGRDRKTFSSFSFVHLRDRFWKEEE